MNVITADKEFVEKDKLIRVVPGRVNEKGICPGATAQNIEMNLKMVIVLRYNGSTSFQLKVPPGAC